MSTERGNHGISDPLVSRAYRELAPDVVPDELDRAVLREAAAGARPRYARAVRWFRPLAWTATIGLCLSIVLELMRVPEPVVDEYDSDRVVEPRFEPRNIEILREADDMARLRNGDRQTAETLVSDPARRPAEARKPACDETATARPSTWLECIDELEKAGRFDAARRERALLIEAFPDAEAP